MIILKESSSIYICCKISKWKDPKNMSNCFSLVIEFFCALWNVCGTTGSQTSLKTILNCRTQNSKTHSGFHVLKDYGVTYEICLFGLSFIWDYTSNILVIFTLSSLEIIYFFYFYHTIILIVIAFNFFHLASNK